MSVQINCDVCHRSCTDYSTIEATHDISPMAPNRNVMHVCHARDGGDVGCIGFFRKGMEHAQELAELWGRENQPWRFNSPYTVPSDVGAAQ